MQCHIPYMSSDVTDNLRISQVSIMDVYNSKLVAHLILARTKVEIWDCPWYHWRHGSHSHYKIHHTLAQTINNNNKSKHLQHLPVVPMNGRNLQLVQMHLGLKTIIAIIIIIIINDSNKI